MFRDFPDLLERAQDLALRTYEFSQFLVQVLGLTDVGAVYRGKVTYHASCHLLREMGVSEDPLLLIKEVKGADFVPLEGASECCGFGGAFSVKYPEISTAILKNKLRNIEQTPQLITNDENIVIEQIDISEDLDLAFYNQFNGTVYQWTIANLNKEIANQINLYIKKSTFEYLIIFRIIPGPPLMLQNFFLSMLIVFYYQRIILLIKWMSDY